MKEKINLIPSWKLSQKSKIYKDIIQWEKNMADSK